MLQAESSFNSAAVSEKNVILSAADQAEAKKHIELYGKVTSATLDAIGRLDAITQAADQRQLIETFRDAVNKRREASAHVFELALAGKVAEAFDYSRGVAAKHRQVAMKAVGALIDINVAKMQAARDESVAMAQQTRRWLVAGAIGKPLRPKSIHFVDDLPRTRNAKILRRVVRSVYTGTDPGDLSSLENPSALAAIGATRS